MIGNAPFTGRADSVGCVCVCVLGGSVGVCNVCGPWCAMCGMCMWYVVCVYEVPVCITEHLVLIPNPPQLPSPNAAVRRPLLQAEKQRGTAQTAHPHVSPVQLQRLYRTVTLSQPLIGHRDVRTVSKLRLKSSDFASSDW